MTRLYAATQAQATKSLHFAWNYNDTALNTLGAVQDFGSVNVAAVAGTPDADSVFVIGYLPPGAVVVGGALQVTTTFDTAGYDIIIGDLDTANNYLTTADRKTAGAEVPLVPTGVACTTANKCTITMSVANDDVCTAGAARVRVDYIVPGRGDEVTHAAQTD